MIKFIILLFNLLGAMIYNSLFLQEVTVTQNVPSSIDPGSEFTVELTINKGSIGGFAKLQQDLPQGFQATVLDAGNASFTFSNKSVKFIWTELPNVPEFKISYKIKVDPSIIGEKTLEGKFSFIEDNVKKSIDVQKAVIKIGVTEQPVASSPETTTPPPVATPPPAPEVTSTPVETVARRTDTVPVFVRRIIPMEAGKEFKVELIIKKGNLTGFGKIQENLPEGLTAVAGELQKGSFSFTEQKVKLVWVALPFAEEFSVSYKVIADRSLGEITLDGTFSYIENEETKKFNIPPSTINIKITQEEPAVAETTPVKEKEPAIQPAVTKVPSPESGINYKVQIAALHTSKKAYWFKKKYNISGEIRTELAEGYTKYTTGSFTAYKSARDYREEIKLAGVEGPFVTAYNNGKRITVQEALMITSQQWYK